MNILINDSICCHIIKREMILAGVFCSKMVWGEKYQRDLQELKVYTKGENVGFVCKFKKEANTIIYTCLD